MMELWLRLASRRCALKWSADLQGTVMPTLL